MDDTLDLVYISFSKFRIFCQAVSQVIAVNGSALFAHGAALVPERRVGVVGIDIVDVPFNCSIKAVEAFEFVRFYRASRGRWLLDGDPVAERGFSFCG